MPYARINGTGSCLPETIITNFDLEQTLDTSHEWIVTRTGIEKRHVVNGQDNVVTMGVSAAEQALQQAELIPQDLDMIIVATCTPEYFFPSVACQIQNKLGAYNCPAFDMSAACSGFVYSLEVARQFIENGQSKNILIVGSEALSKALDWNDRSTCVLFGDGAGAMVLSQSDQSGILASDIAADGRQQSILCLPSPYNDQVLAGEISAMLNMQGQEVFRHAVEKLSSSVECILQKAQLTSQDIDFMVPHQANIRIINALAKRLGMSAEHVITTVHEHANTSSASIPLAFDKAVTQGQIKAGDKVLLEAFGGGLTWGGMLLNY